MAGGSQHNRPLGKSRSHLNNLRAFLALVIFGSIIARQSVSTRVRSWAPTPWEAKQLVVYIAGRNPAGGGDKTIIDELGLSVMSACRVQAIRHIGSSTNFVIFISEPDYNICSGSKPGHCVYSKVEELCQSHLPDATFRYAPMDEEILMMWKNHTGIVSFSHHSTWFGYTKIWLPILLGSMGYKSSAALFVDTDTVWNDSPSAIFDELINFNSTQVFGATGIVDRHKFANSLSFRNRITSGILLMDLGGL